jgi:hypothetical protein
MRWPDVSAVTCAGERKKLSGQLISAPEAVETTPMLFISPPASTTKRMAYSAR